MGEIILGKCPERVVLGVVQGNVQWGMSGNRPGMAQEKPGHLIGSMLWNALPVNWFERFLRSSNARHYGEVT